MKTETFHPNAVHTLVFDLDSLTGALGNEQWQNFNETLRILNERDFRLVLLAEDIAPEDWQHLSLASVVAGPPAKVGPRNPRLGHKDHFWVTNQTELHAWLEGQDACFAINSSKLDVAQGFLLQRLEDLLHIFHPSRNAALQIAESLLERKRRAPTQPMLVGVGGPDECGHAFFVGELLEALEEREILVGGFDLQELLGTEFHTPAKSHLWRSDDLRSWTLEHLLRPYSRGEVVTIEQEPPQLRGYETAPFPLFWAPEMIVLVWGTTLFTPELNELLDSRILLDLTAKAATARLFQLDDREDFNPEFVETYLKGEGYIYQQYMEANQVRERADFVVRFDNFHAFSLAER